MTNFIELRPGSDVAERDQVLDIVSCKSPSLSVMEHHVSLYNDIVEGWWDLSYMDSQASQQVLDDPLEWEYRRQLTSCTAAYPS